MSKYVMCRESGYAITLLFGMTACMLQPVWAYTLGEDQLGGLFDSGTVDFNGSFSVIDLSESFSTGQIFGSHYRTDPVKLFGKTIVPSYEVDTRTGLKASVATRTNAQLIAQNSFDPGKWASELQFDVTTQTASFTRRDFVNLGTSLDLHAATTALRTPSFSSALGFSFDNSLSLDVDAYVLGKHVGMHETVSMQGAMTLFEANVEGDSASLSLPLSNPLDGLGLPIDGLDWSTRADLRAGETIGLGDVLKRFGFGAKQAPDGSVAFQGDLVVVDLVSPLSGRNHFDLIDENNTIGFDTEVKVVRAGLDMVELLARAGSVPTGVTGEKGLFEYAIQPLGSELQLEMGLSMRRTHSADLVVDLTNDGTTSVDYLDADGGVRSLGPGQTLAGQSWLSLPDFQSNGDAIITASFESLDLTTTTEKALTFTGLQSVTVPKKINVKAKNGTFLDKLKAKAVVFPTASFQRDLGSLGEVVLQDDKDTSSMDLSGLGITYQIAINPEAPRYASLDRSRVSMQPGDLDAVRFIDWENGPGFDEQFPLDYTSFRNQDYVLEVDSGVPQRIDNVDFDHLFSGVRVNAGGSLTVGLLDQRPENLLGIGSSQGIPDIHNDGELIMGTRNALGADGANSAGETIWFNSIRKRTFAGEGGTRILLGENDAMRMYVSSGGKVSNEAGHTLGIEGGASVWLGEGGAPYTAAMVNNGELELRDHQMRLSMVGEQADWTKDIHAEGGVAASRHTANRGTLRVAEGSLLTLNMAHQFENSGRLLVESGSRVDFEGDRGNRGFSLWNTGGRIGKILVSGEDSFAEFLDGDGNEVGAGNGAGNLRVRAGKHLIEVSDGGEVQFDAGIGRNPDAYGPEDAGQLTLDVGAGGRMSIAEIARFDGRVQVAEDGVLQLNGLGSRTAGGLNIVNDGLLEVLSGIVGTVRYFEFSLPQNSDPLPPVADVEPIDLHNGGTIRVHNNASVLFNANVVNYADNGVAFEAGSWELLGGNLAIGLKRVQLDDSLLEGLENRSADLPTLDDLRITHNRSNITLADDATLRYGAVGANDAEVYGILASGRNYLGDLEINEAGLVLRGRSDMIGQSFTNQDGGQLDVQNGVLTVNGDFTTRVGDVELISARLDAASYTVEGGRMSVDGDSLLEGFWYVDPGVDERFIVGRDVRVSSVNDSANEDGGVSIAGELDLGGRTIKTLAANVELQGANSRFEALKGFDLITASGSLLLNNGAYTEASTEEVGEGLQNYGGLTVSHGSILKIFGDYFLRGGGSTQVDTQGAILADDWVLEAGHQLSVDGVVGASSMTIVGEGSLLSGSGSVHGDLSLGDGARINPGNSPGTLSLYGDQLFGAGSFLTTEVVSGIPGGFDLLQIFGSLTLDGANWELDFSNFGWELMGLPMDVLAIFPGSSTSALTGWFDDFSIVGLAGTILDDLSSQPMDELTHLMYIDGGLYLDLISSYRDDGSLVFSLQFSGVPTPAMFNLLLIGFVAFAAVAMRRKRSR